LAYESHGKSWWWKGASQEIKKDIKIENKIRIMKRPFN
jgi:hypothetical protein